MLVFLGVVGAIVAAIHGYLWTRLVRDPAWPDAWRKGLTWALVALAVSVVAVFLVVRPLPRAAAAPFAWVAFTWMGAMFYLLLATALADLVFLFVTRSPGASRTAAIVVAGAAALVCVAGAMSAHATPTVERVDVPIRRLDARLDGLRIVLLTDIHVSATRGRGFVEEVVAQVNALDPDVVAIAGDLVDGTVEHLREEVAPIRGLRARHGVFFVTGNHEYYSGADAWCAHVASLGIRVLRNERTAIERDGAALDVAGIEDPTGEGTATPPDLARALAGRDASRPVVLLAHQAVAVHDAEKAGVDLQLSGHGHGGQLAPFGLITRLAQPVLHGLHRFGGTWLYVSRGTGYWGPPMRVLAPSEITVVTLRAEGRS